MRQGHSLTISLLLALGGCSDYKGTTLNTPSPDGKSAALLIEKKAWIDRNFDVFIEDRSAKPSKRKLIFSSPDECQPGTERFLWSKDSKYLLLVGKEFLVKTSSESIKGEHLYLLWEAESGKLSCNASQQDKFPNFTVDDVSKLEWSDSAFRK